MKDWIRKDIATIKDVMDDRGNILTYATLETKLGNKATRVFEYNAVRTAIEQAKQQNRLHLTYNENITAVNTTFKKKKVEKLTVRDFRELLNKNNIVPCARGFWKRKLDEDITEINWKLAIGANKETRLRVLQWKILHNIYPTRILLYRIGKVDSEICDACNTVQRERLH